MEMVRLQSFLGRVACQSKHCAESIQITLELGAAATRVEMQLIGIAMPGRSCSRAESGGTTLFVGLQDSGKGTWSRETPDQDIAPHAPVVTMEKETELTDVLKIQSSTLARGTTVQQAEPVAHEKSGTTKKEVELTDVLKNQSSVLGRGTAFQPSEPDAHEDKLSLFSLVLTNSSMFGNLKCDASTQTMPSKRPPPLPRTGKARCDAPPLPRGGIRLRKRTAEASTDGYFTGTQVILRTSKRILSQFKETPIATMKHLIQDTILHLNCRGKGCCALHVTLVNLKEGLEAMCSWPCDSKYLPYTGWQCQVCLCMNPDEDPDEIDDADVPRCEICEAAMR
eukprot:TRINITY_DN7853_c0_g1_i4.p1 TRINITY_DN7853_c0_g1~~TRINITY_DN7853_c0_g1_i4.p1  ORF type:complete len:338 (-),score=46.57 TRINITY_DN7853_c0_g1_i4:102-1115(-)